ncbi:MAG: hypothetical protein LBT50_05380 [Prevotellaceae bacterium]|nr:hypothetical protein [Prevotellaceae bacterium]
MERYLKMFIVRLVLVAGLLALFVSIAHLSFGIKLSLLIALAIFLFLLSIPLITIAEISKNEITLANSITSLLSFITILVTAYISGIVIESLFGDLKLSDSPGFILNISIMFSVELLLFPLVLIRQIKAEKTFLKAHPEFNKVNAPLTGLLKGKNPVKILTIFCVSGILSPVIVWIQFGNSNLSVLQVLSANCFILFGCFSAAFLFIINQRRRTKKLK